MEWFHLWIQDGYFLKDYIYMIKLKLISFLLKLLILWNLGNHRKKLMLKIKNRVNKAKLPVESSIIPTKIKMGQHMEFIKDFIGTREEFLLVEPQTFNFRACMVQCGQVNMLVILQLRGYLKQKVANSAILKEDKKTLEIPDPQANS